MEEAGRIAREGEKSGFYAHGWNVINYDYTGLHLTLRWSPRVRYANTRPPNNEPSRGVRIRIRVRMSVKDEVRVRVRVRVKLVQA